MSKFRKHTVEEMRRRSKMRKQRKKYKRNSVKVIGHSSSTDTPEEVSEGTVNFKRGKSAKEQRILKGRKSAKEQLILKERKSAKEQRILKGNELVKKKEV